MMIVYCPDTYCQLEAQAQIYNEKMEDRLLEVDSVRRKEEEQAPQQSQHSFLGQVVGRMQLRLSSIELKLMTLSKVVRLLQDYTEKKDQQYEHFHSHSIPDLAYSLTTVEAVQKQLTDVQYHIQQITRQQQLQNIQLQKLAKEIAGREYQASIREAEERVEEQMQVLRGKVQRVEEVMLRQAKEDHLPVALTSISRQQLDLAMQRMESQVRMEVDHIQAQLCRCKATNNCVNKQENSYGINTKRASKSRRKNYQFSSKRSNPK